jgi:hypothetical protein
VTDAELAELLLDCPVLYHMAERGSWPSIRRHGLLSTSALLDLYDVAGSEREAIEARRRPDGVVIESPSIGRAVVRDQKPMDDAGLRRCLHDDLQPEDWYRLLNRKVFFWLTSDRLLRLVGAKPYRSLEHDVLEIDAGALVSAYRRSITLSPINSGATKPFPAPRGRATFLPISDYPYADWSNRRKRGERAVELVVEHGVPDITRFVQRVLVMQGETVLSVEFERPF